MNKQKQPNRPFFDPCEIEKDDLEHTNNTYKKENLLIRTARI